MRQPTADQGIQQRTPKHVAGNGDAEDVDAARHAPQNNRERDQADHVADQAQAEGERAVGEGVEVFADALVRVVGVTALLQLVVVFVSEPARKVLLGQPAPPANGQHLRQVKPVHRAHDTGGGNQPEVADQVPESRAVFVFQCVIEVFVPMVDPYRYADADQRQGNHRDQQQPGPGALLTAPVRRYQPPDARNKISTHSIIYDRRLSVLIHRSGSVGVKSNLRADQGDRRNSTL